LSAAGKSFENLILRTVQTYIEERDLLNASQFGFRAEQSTTLQCMRLADYITLNFSNNISTAVVLLGIEKAFDTTRHYGLVYKLLELKFSTNLVKVIASVLTNRKFVFGRRRISTPTEVATQIPQGSVLATILCSPRHLEPVLLCSRTIPVFTRQRNKNIVFSVTCNAASLR
jgi:hypothetical protein